MSAVSGEIMRRLSEDYGATQALETAAYVEAVVEAVETDAELALTGSCRECGRNVVAEEAELIRDAATGAVLMIDDHLLVVGSVDCAVVVGCEGYWQVDPASVGVWSPDWQPPEGGE